MISDGLKELKVFVDLALISAGEQPLDIDRVQGLNTAVLGYSPLIFHLNPDADYIELLDKCKLVWKELDTNPKLPEKLVCWTSYISLGERGILSCIYHMVMDLWMILHHILKLINH